MLHFHKAELVDAAAVAHLINSCFRGEASRKGWTTEADILDGLRTTTSEIAETIKCRDAFVLIGVLYDEIVAAVCCQLETIAGRKVAHLSKIVVKPTLQNKGYGKDLIAAAEALTQREWRVLGFYMLVISMRHELIVFYERLGYRQTEEFVTFPEKSDLWQPKIDGLRLQYLTKLVSNT